MKTLPVIFRKYTSNGDILAIFPTLPALHSSPHTVTCYEHIGQHGSMAYGYMEPHTVKASPSEYAELYAELITIGYNNLKVVQRRSTKMIDEAIEYLNSL